MTRPAGTGRLGGPRRATRPASIEVCLLRPSSDVDLDRVARLLKPWRLRRAYHRAAIEGVERIPAMGGALLVGNHGRLDFDFFMLMGLILEARGRLPRLLADHLWFRLPPTRRLASVCGAVDGTPENALALLRAGELVLTYPGGVREIAGSHYGREDIDWRGRTGFARVALEAGVPVVPVAGLGVNSGHVFLSSGRRLGHLLYRRLFGMGPAYDSYRDPLTIGLLPVPLPFSAAVHFPLPCRVRYVVGEPVHPGRGNAAIAGEPTERAVRELAWRAAVAMNELIARHARPLRP